MYTCWWWGCLRVLRAWGRLGLMRLLPYGSRHLYDRTSMRPPTVLPASQPFPSPPPRAWPEPNPAWSAQGHTHGHLEQPGATLPSGDSTPRPGRPPRRHEALAASQYDGSARRQTTPRPPERPRAKSNLLRVWIAHALRTWEQRVSRALATASHDGWGKRPDAKAQRPTASLDERDRHCLEPPQLAFRSRRPSPHTWREATQSPGKGSSA